jgi:two-component sensor histidine kinase
MSSSITKNLYAFANCLRLILEAAAISFNVRGALISLQEMYIEAAISPETALPRANFLHELFYRCMQLFLLLHMAMQAYLSIFEAH